MAGIFIFLLYTYRMSVPNIETFEHDISEEIKTKEATIGDIASAGGDVGNSSVKPSNAPVLLISLGILFFVVVAGISVFLIIRYRYSLGSSAPVAQTDTQITPSGIRLDSISSSLGSAISPSVASIQKSPYGYVIELSSYPDVFAYMLKNESRYADEIATAVGSPRDMSSTTSLPFSFSDVTINNQNMRVGTSGSSTVVYAFVNTKYLLISKDTEGILSLRGGILH